MSERNAVSAISVSACRGWQRSAILCRQLQLQHLSFSGMPAWIGKGNLWPSFAAVEWINMIQVASNTSCSMWLTGSSLSWCGGVGDFHRNGGSSCHLSGWWGRDGPSDSRKHVGKLGLLVGASLSSQSLRGKAHWSGTSISMLQELLKRRCAFCARWFWLEEMWPVHLAGEQCFNMFGAGNVVHVFGICIK